MLSVINAAWFFMMMLFSSNEKHTNSFPEKITEEPLVIYTPAGVKIPAVVSADSIPEKVVTGLDFWNKNNPVEKVFLHTDKGTYMAGDNIWYSAYMTLDRLPSILSKVLYIDLVDENGKVIDKQMRPLTNGTASGDIIIPKNLPTGNYSVNAYSLWMLNYQPYIFQKAIRIYNSDYKPGTAAAAVSPTTVYFFPEGGDLVEGLKSTVAFFAVNKKGIPQPAKGKIVDGTGKTITTITTDYRGYGKFEITPGVNEKLTAVMTSANGVENSYALPLAKKEGVVIQVNNSNVARSFVQVSRNVKDKEQYNKLLVVAQMEGKPAYMGTINFAEDATGMAIPKKNLPSGIMQITVFDGAGKPLAERLVFVNNLDGSQLPVATDSISLKARGKNKYAIDLSAYNKAMVSVAVTDADLTAAAGTEENILSGLLLTADLKGYIHQPGYYFRNKDASTTEHLDLLMMTHGWRRFNWEDVIAKKLVPIKYPVESGITIAGMVTLPQSVRSVAGGYVDIITKTEDSTTILSKAMLNDKGQFMVNDISFRQGATLYLQGSKASNTNAKVDVILNKSYIDTLKFSRLRPLADLDTFSLASKDNKLFNLVSTPGMDKMITLEEVKVVGKKVSRLDSLNTNYASDIFRSGQTLEVERTHYISIWQFLREQVNGLVVEGDIVNPNVYFNRFQGERMVATVPEEETDDAGNTSINGITYFLNEMPVSKDVINTIHPTDVALVKVFKGAEGAALGTDEGGIAIYTKKGIPVGTRPGEKGFFVEKRMGYTSTREFFNPDYGVAPDSGSEDKRTTLYWNPQLKTDKSNVARIKFFNSDNTKRFKVVIQGMDANGKLIYTEKIFE